ncbi:FMN phosphatase YigB (HAD superfamily) [Geothermobacter ehrlichii]|uniref:phosphoglycolate phosphatase n=1 Tax=Geothermobacter ehrlichii TaxID=213224 RepID=A0A5D3WKM7_9BACT|nr:HAD family hydrolase [Geothermobacter ehrlichii]TYO98486.1 FMN phosphatase YigB (HAD superfamily) [Geothermobacter ehrlichii]
MQEAARRLRARRLKLLLFDLDGTLLRVEMHRFIPAYLAGIAARLDGELPPADFQRLARKGIRLLLSAGDGRMTNAERFFGFLSESSGLPVARLARAVEDFCRDGLATLRPLVEAVPTASALLDAAFATGCRVVVATNPVFPKAAIDARLAWAGLDGYPFDLVTDWDRSRYCKPQQDYFHDLLRHFAVAPEQVLMIGNDTGHDMAAGQIGIATFLVDSWLIEREESFPADLRGGHAELLTLLRCL